MSGEGAEVLAIRPLHEWSLPELWAYALPRACPKCGAEAGASCENLTERKRGVVKRVVWPHDARYAELRPAPAPPQPRTTSSTPVPEPTLAKVIDMADRRGRLW